MFTMLEACDSELLLSLHNFEEWKTFKLWAFLADISQFQQMKSRLTLKRDLSVE